MLRAMQIHGNHPINHSDEFINCDFSTTINVNEGESVLGFLLGHRHLQTGQHAPKLSQAQRPIFADFILIRPCRSYRLQNTQKPLLCPTVTIPILVKPLLEPTFLLRLASRLRLNPCHDAGEQPPVSLGLSEMCAALELVSQHTVSGYAVGCRNQTGVVRGLQEQHLAEQHPQCTLKVLHVPAFQGEHPTVELLRVLRHRQKHDITEPVAESDQVTLVTGTGSLGVENKTGRQHHRQAQANHDGGHRGGVPEAVS
mmetsp:Transcript_112640/g.258024  ORF Transcript_112640/g.258024 Transcript_112640/m.258024 type:complete len:255 (-) Transcript_112640:726-1490(-)